MDQAIYHRFDLICAISEGVREALVSSYPKVAGRCHVVLNGSDLRFSKPTLRQARPTLTVVSAGRLVPQKNYLAAIRAFALVEDHRWRYIILGEGTERPRLEALIKELNLAGRVELRGYVSDVGPILQEADLFLIPSSWEGFGLAAVEAMNAALPLVVSNVPGLREVVGTDEACALLVQPDDPQSIANALKSLAASSERCRAMGAEGFRRAGRFSIQTMADNYLSCYRSLLEEQQ
jgi:glycosyltransferase involved in cell wall biosynthesis